jgi:hypothetical protein
MRVLLLLIVVAPAFAQTVYKSVENGVTSFSDTPPQDTASVETLTIDTPPAADDGLLEERLTQMRETTDRMAEDRRERERHRAELREQSPEPQVIQQPVPVWAGNYWPAYRSPVRPRPPLRPGHPRPTPLPAAPPGWSVMQPGNEQLMRPVVSSRRRSGGK